MLFALLSAKTHLCMCLLVLEKSKFADCLFRREPTFLRETTSAMHTACLALMLLRVTYAHFCSNGRTPLHKAIDGNHSDIVEYLRSVGAPE
jgi:hypothetical protein